MNRSRYFYIAAGFVVIAGFSYLIFSPGNNAGELYVPVKKGDLRIEVTATGELRAKNSVMIPGPGILSSMPIFDIKVQSLLPEGTKVQRGDIIATLEPEKIKTLIRQAEESCREGKVKLDEILLDTTQTLKESRDQIKNLEFDVEEARIATLQSKYEVPAILQKVRNDSVKAERTLANARSKYRIEKTKAENRVRNARSNYNESFRLFSELNSALDSLVIRAPGPGMLIYHRRPSQEKIVAGSSLSPSFDFYVAELPDLSQMKSVTGINEIDIDKVHPGQPVSIGIDAFPGKKFMGHVIEVANMGMEDPVTGSKMFEVVILLDNTHTILRPGMTSMNSIATGTFQNVLLLPVDAVFLQEGKGAFVYKKNSSRVSRVPVVTGPSNEAFIIIREGLQENDLVTLSGPE